MIIIYYRMNRKKSMNLLYTYSFDWREFCFKATNMIDFIISIRTKNILYNLGEKHTWIWVYDCYNVQKWRNIFFQGHWAAITSREISNFLISKSQKLFASLYYILGGFYQMVLRCLYLSLTVLIYEHRIIFMYTENDVMTTNVWLTYS